MGLAVVLEDVVVLAAGLAGDALAVFVVFTVFFPTVVAFCPLALCLLAVEGLAIPPDCALGFLLEAELFVLA